MRIAIGDFSRMTHLSIKALRHYHDLGVLVPAEVDPSSGYRIYRADQVPVAQLSQIQGTVAALRSLLEGPPAPVAVEHRAVPAVPALAIAERVTMAEQEAWWADAFDELHATVEAAGVTPGTGGGLYPGALFEVEVAEIVAFLPVPGEIPGTQRAGVVEIPAAELAVAVHRGPFAELDRTYAAVGTHVAARELGVDGPIREYYLETATPDESQHRIEVCWPIFRTGSGR